MPSFDDRRGSAGFSLLEVLVALVITGLALSAIAAALGSGVVAVRTSEGATTALVLAEEKIASAGAGHGLQPGTSHGSFGDRFEWRLRISPYKPSSQDELNDEGPTHRLEAYRIEVAVSWRTGWQRRHLKLSTLRVGAPPQ